MYLRKCVVRVILLILFIFSFDTLALAEKTSGYIVTLKSDTIYGSVQLSHFDQVTGGLILNGIEEESFHFRVVFIAKGEKHFKTYFPEMLLGFGFNYRSINYVYQRFLEKRKSIFKCDQQQYRFMRLINETETRYKDLRMMQNPGLQSNRDNWVKFNEYTFKVNQKIKAGNRDTLKGL